MIILKLIGIVLSCAAFLALAYGAGAVLDNIMAEYRRRHYGR